MRSLAALTVLIAAVIVASAASPTMTTNAWSDEFDGPEGAPPDPANWTYDIGTNNGWGNYELQQYTDQTANVHLDGHGHLAIRLARTATGFTSARLKTAGLRTFRYGYLEGRLKAAGGEGVSSAFWLLGDRFNGRNWPDVSEIDIVEVLGRQPSTSLGTVHGPGCAGASGISTRYVLAGGRSFADDFHTFGVRWQPDRITFNVDGHTYKALTRSDLPAKCAWVFDQPVFVLLNVAIGGSFSGPPTSNTVLPQSMLVDYIRYTPLESGR